MNPRNGHANGSGSSQPDGKQSPSRGAVIGTSTSCQFTPKQIQELVAELEVPFDSWVIEWRVTNTTRCNGNARGQVIPYADQRAYTDRLNRLFSPAGWTRRYAVHTSANFQRGEDEKTVAKVFVTCELTIFGLGSHSATGEEWTDNDNAGTSAEAQAFKRACSCFGLGRYLYYFTGVWMDLTERKRLKAIPKLAGWATPEGWRQGLRPDRTSYQESLRYSGDSEQDGRHYNDKTKVVPGDEHATLIRQIESMAKPLGKGIYRGLLKTLARVWSPSQIEEPAVLQNVLTEMQSAEHGLRRLEAALKKTQSEALVRTLNSLNLTSLDRVDNLEILRKIVDAVEAEATASEQF